ncbi:three-helix bundle dimerization domain-containing protein [Kribbella pratensis]|uniref:three-helix bundle dimerization domain-containing protein n=1 Tax=Kribbella pratensis TaxID=2512112 RepID=UPI0035129C74
MPKSPSRPSPWTSPAQSSERLLKPERNPQPDPHTGACFGRPTPSGPAGRSALRCSILRRQKPASAKVIGVSATVRWRTEFADAPIRAFVPLFVERSAKHKLNGRLATSR